MWFLTHESRIIYLKKGVPITLGRKECDVEFENDMSLSRQHAVITVQEDDFLTITDTGSKYGTFINDRRAETEKLIHNEATRLEDGDKILLGRFSTELLVVSMNLKPSISMLDVEKKTKLTAILHDLEIKLSDSFDTSCTHLTMPLLTNVSTKLIQALVFCKPVVTPKFWVEFKNSVENSKPLPKVLDYLPKLKEDEFVRTESISLAIDESRKKLFHGKTFYFLTTSDMQPFVEIITGAGGEVVAMSQTKVSTATVCAKNAIVIQSSNVGVTESQNDDKVDKIREALDHKRLRMIPVIEISSAILENSIERWCNPEVTSMTNLFFDRNDASLLQAARSKVIVPESVPTVEPVKPQILMMRLDESDEEVDMIDKENFPTASGHQQTEISLNIPETQASTERSYNLNIPETQESQQQNQVDDSRSKSIISQLSRAINDDSDLFSFSSNSANQLRKRKNSEDSVETHTTKRNKFVEDFDENFREAHQPSRKRQANESSDGLFEFKRTAPKKLKTNDDSFTVSSFTPLSRPVASVSEPRLKIYEDQDDSCDSGVWLSKAMSSINISNVKQEPDLIKTEPVECNDTQDIKPASLRVLFDVIDNSSDNNITPMSSSRKQFVKKKNFKPQKQVVTMQVVKVEDTFISLDDF